MGSAALALVLLIASGWGEKPVRAERGIGPPPGTARGEGARPPLALSQAAASSVAPCTATGMRDEYDRDITRCTALLRRDPDNAAAYAERGAAYAGEGAYDRAVADCSRAIELDPANARAYRNRGAAHAAEGEYGQAVADCSTAIRLEPRNALGYQNRGAAYGYQGRYAEAIRDFDEALRLDPGNVRVYVNRGRMFAATAQFDRAVADFTAAIAIDRGDMLPSPAASARPASGVGAAPARQPDRTVWVGPRGACVYYFRACAYAAEGDRDRAIEDLAAALRLDPENTRAHSALEQLGPPPFTVTPRAVGQGEQAGHTSDRASEDRHPAPEATPATSGPPSCGNGRSD